MLGTDFLVEDGKYSTSVLLVVMTHDHREGASEVLSALGIDFGLFGELIERS